MITLLIGALAGSVINGALGYGFASVTVPIALLALSNAALTPALVTVELVVNGWSLWLNRSSIRNGWRTAAPVTLGLLPGLVVGSSALGSVDGQWLKVATYAALLPIAALQFIGFRRQFRRERTVGLSVGTGVGALYSLTAISGPPLALFLNNQGLTHTDFRAALSIIRLTASVIALALFAPLGILNREAAALLPWIVPAVLVGMPIGVRLASRIGDDEFRRIAMGVNTIVILVGAAVAIRGLSIDRQGAALLVFAIGASTLLVGRALRLRAPTGSRNGEAAP